MTLITTSATARHRQARPASLPESSQRWRGVPEKNTSSHALPWGTGSACELDAGLYWYQVPEQDIALRIRWGIAAGRDAHNAASWYQVPDKDQQQAVAWRRTKRQLDPCLRVRFKPRLPEKDMDQLARYGRVDEFGPRRSPEQIMRDSLYLPNTVPVVFEFGGRRYQPALMPELVFDFRYQPKQYRSQPVDSGASRIRWGTAEQINADRRVRWRWGIPTDPVPTDVRYPDWDGPVIIIPDPESAGEPDIKETYMIPNSVAVTVLPDGTPLAADSFTISRDIDSYSWSLDMQLFGRESMQLVRPDGSGQKNIQIVINGHTWVFLVSGYSSADKFPAERFSVKGSSRTQLLGEPYARQFSAVNAVDINARQAVEDLLQHTGFTLTWDSVNQNPSDWTISAGALSYTDQTPMQVACRVAESIGAVIKPSMALDEFAVVPRYRDPVWHWNTTLVDRIVPHQIISDMAGEWSPRPEYNSCYVSGVSYGVAVDVRRAGTAGNEPAPDVYDELITSTDAARMRGIAEICKGGNQEVVTLTIPLFPAETPPGLIHPAALCEIRPYNEANWRGLCLSTTISVVNYSTVHQQIKLERHHGNS